MNIAEFTESVYIMPAGAVGAAVYYYLNENDFTPTPILGILDNVKTGEFLGTPLLKPEQADKNVPVIISSFRYGNKLMEQLQNLGFKTIIKASDIINKANIPEIINSSKKYSHPYSVLDLENALNAYLFNPDLNSEFVTLPKAELVVTQKCSLRCKECAALMPYYKEPKSVDIRVITKSLDNLFSIASIKELSILGGEPFLCKDLDLVLKEVQKHRQKCAEVLVITNGTILPKAKVIEAMKEANVMVEISDYGYLNKKESSIFEEMKRNGIRCRKRSMKWFKMQSFVKEPWNDNEMKRIFENCQYYCRQIMNGKLFYCLFACHAQEIGAIPKTDENDFNLLSAHLNGQSLLDYCNRKEPLPACRYCSGWNFSLNEPIPVALQLEASEVLEMPRFR
jgi:organic radical activating enzyme